LPHFIEGVLSIQLFVPQKLVKIAVQAVGARFDHGIHDGAVAAPEFGTVGVGFHFEFR
jgi:hypothetical protein